MSYPIETRPLSPTVDFTDITLWKERVGVTQAFGPQLLHDLTVEQHEAAFHNMVMTLSTFVLTDKLENAEEEFEFSWPRSWWQSFKEKNLPNFVRWHLLPGVKHEHRKVRATVESKACFPRSTVILPELGDAVHFRQVNWNVHPTSAL